MHPLPAAKAPFTASRPCPTMQRSPRSRCSMSALAMDPPPRILLTKIGLDGHDRGSRVVAAFLRDAGMDVLYTPPWQEIRQVVRLAEEEDVDAIGISSLATDHLLVPKLMNALKKAQLEHIPLVV